VAVAASRDIGRYSGAAANLNMLWHPGARFYPGYVRQDVAILVVEGKGVQEASDVDLVACEVSADGVGINGDEH
jgi:hypothetical protein